jgi:hypothetical protein
MTKQTAQRIQAAISLVGVLGVLGVKLYVIGWLDDWRIVTAAIAIPVGVFAWWWWRNAASERRERDAMNERWAARQRVSSSTQHNEK